LYNRLKTALHVLEKTQRTGFGNRGILYVIYGINFVINFYEEILIEDWHLRYNVKRRKTGIALDPAIKYPTVRAVAGKKE